MSPLIIDVLLRRLTCPHVEVLFEHREVRFEIGVRIDYYFKRKRLVQINGRPIDARSDRRGRCRGEQQAYQYRRCLCERPGNFYHGCTSSSGHTSFPS